MGSQLPMHIETNVRIETLGAVSATFDDNTKMTTVSIQHMKPGTALIFRSSSGGEVRQHVTACYRLVEKAADLSKMGTRRNFEGGPQLTYIPFRQHFH